jgi:gas vesicle protein
LGFVSCTTLNLNEPKTWSTDNLKLWLAEHDINFEGITQKPDLVNLVENSRIRSKQTWDSVDEAVGEFTNRVGTYLKELLNEYKDASQNDLQAFQDKAASNIEDVRESIGLNEDQMAGALEKIKFNLGSTDAKINKAIQDIGRSYAFAKLKRDEIVRESLGRIREDYKNSKDVSTDWLKDKCEDLYNSAGFAKSRIRSQYVLIINDIHEKLVSSKDMSADQAKAVCDKLLASLDATYNTTSSKLYRLRRELYNAIGSLAYKVVSEIKSQFAAINDYRQLTQDRIQSVTDQIGQKLADGKEYTVEQVDAIKNAAANYLSRARDDANSLTDQTKQTILETKQTQEDRFNRLAEYLRNMFKKSRDASSEQISILFSELQDKLVATQNLTKEQARMVKETMDEKLGDVKDAKDLSEEQVNNFIDALRQKFADAYDATGQKYESVASKVKEQLPTKDEL